MGDRLQGSSSLGPPVAKPQSQGGAIGFLRQAGMFCITAERDFNRTFKRRRYCEEGSGVARYGRDYACFSSIFEAERFPDSHRLELTTEGRNFAAWATPWEKQYCLPLGKGRPFNLPVVDDEQMIIGHIGAASNRNLWVMGVDGKPQVYCRDVDSGWHVDEAAWRDQFPETYYAALTTEQRLQNQSQHGWRHFKADYTGYIVFCNVNGQVLELLSFTNEFDQIESNGLGPLDWIMPARAGAAILKGLGKRLVKSVGTSGARTLTRIATRRINLLGTATEAEMNAVAAIRAGSPELSSLTHGEILAIRAYTGERWAAINASARGVAAASTGTSALTTRIVSGLKKLRGFKGQVVRTEAWPIEEAAAKYMPGKTITVDGMLSTSKTIAVAQREGNIAITIHAIGKQGKDISKLAVHAESEVLFPPGSRFTVESAERIENALIVVLKEL